MIVKIPAIGGDNKNRPVTTAVEFMATVMLFITYDGDEDGETLALISILY